MSFIAMMRSLKNGQNFAFVRGALKQSRRGVLMSKMEDEEVKVAFEATVIQVNTCPTMAQLIATGVATEGAKMTLMAMFVAC